MGCNGICAGGDSSSLAAWVQAVGSILAIWAAFEIARWQWRRDRRERQAGEEQEAMIVAGAIAPLVLIYLRRINFFKQQLLSTDDQVRLAEQVPEDAFDLNPVVAGFQFRFGSLGRTGVLANELIGHLVMLATACRVIHRERLRPEAHQRMKEVCDEAGGCAENLLKELDAICPPKRDDLDSPLYRDPFNMP